MPRAKRHPYSTSAIWFATVFGSPLATAWLCRANRLASAQPQMGLRAERVLWLIGVVALGLSWAAPPDFLSQLFSAGIFSYLAVGGWLALNKPQALAPTGQATPAASRWQVLRVILIIRLGFLAISFGVGLLIGLIQG